MPQIPSSSSSPRRGMAIGIVLMIGLIVLVLGISMIATSGNLLRSTVDAKERIRSRYAAEAMVAIQMAVATEKAGNEFGSELKLPSITLTDLTTGPGEKAEAEMVSLAGSKAKPVQEVIPSGDYRGLRGLKIPFLIKSIGYAPGGAKTQVNAEIRMYQIPIFQFGVFYEGNLEITPGPDMTVGGPVHTNSNAYFRAFGDNKNLSFQGPVTAAGAIYTWRRAVDGDLRFLFTPKNPANYFIMQNLAMNPTPATANTLPPETDGRSNVTPNAPKMKLPIGSASPIELIAPRDSSDPPELARQKFDHKIDCSSGCLNRYVVGESPTKPAWIRDPRVFWDIREQRWVKVWDFDVAEMGTKSNDSIFYLADFTKEYDNRSPADSIIPAFRIINASKLPRNLTIASANPVYLLGDFNSQPTIGCGDASSITLPPGGDYCNAMIAANSFTVLSGNWPTLDFATRGIAGSMEQPYSPKNAWSNKTGITRVIGANPKTPWDVQTNGASGYATGVTIRVNAAILAGNKQSPASTFAAPLTDAQYEAHYEGGWHNTFRFLEHLGNSKMIFRGSFVCLWEAKSFGLQLDPNKTIFATNYYAPPERDWGFDPRFSNLNNMPPGTPYLVTSQFTGWSEPRW